ncbi:lactonase family protein [Flavobacterium sp. UMI-01]|uniref:lactonase family protein n=1 Tax=Flavobacterium sp. UMI-01 TaxID=1441053 RepID=UPI00208D08AA|nr:lactonase family protein [Flavobacterium sp. UMI-01]GIZ07589.1 6-phosphogluconolactonase [Flavobacterium sp. UMI-01]
MMKAKGTILLFFMCLFFAQAQNTKHNLLIGTFTNKCESNGVYVYEFDSQTAEFKLKSESEKIVSPGYLTVSPDNQYVYTVNSDGANSSVSAFGYVADSGKLNLLNQEKTTSENPCYIINDNKNVITANYGGGSVTVFGKNKNGSVGALKQLVQHSGTGPNSKRQEKAHLHMVQFAPDHKMVLGTDLGSDKVYVYAYAPDADKPLTLKQTIAVKAGSGPRHFTFSNDGKKLYLLGELNGVISVFNYKKGKVSLLQEQSVVAPDFKASFTAADIHISPDEKFLYATNRAEANDISCFKILKNGTLEFVERVATRGNGPRNFAIDPTGNFLLIGHQFSNEVVIFKRDKNTGKLTYSGQRIPLCSPVCLVFTKNK